MKSETVRINNKENMDAVLVAADNFIQRLSIDKKNALHLRLIVEETVGMLGAMVGTYHAKVYLEGDETECSVFVSATTDMDLEKKKELLSVSTSGKNASVKGFMSKIGDMIENGFLHLDGSSNLQMAYGGTMLGYGYSDPGTMNAVSGMDAELIWTLEAYRKHLPKQGVSEETEALEKSIVANLASNIIVGVKKDDITMQIIKKMA